MQPTQLCLARRGRAFPVIVVILTLVLAAFSLLPTSTARAAGVLYVRASATGANNGSSWLDAYPNLQTALAAATSGTEVWVATGTYTPTALTKPADPRSATFVLTSGVALYGGFAGLVTETLATRDWVTNVVTLSGDLSGNDSGTVGSDNSYHVVTSIGTDATAILDGFTISSGNADGGGDADSGGGGGMFTRLSSATVRNVTFIGNSAIYGGGGTYIESSNPTLSNVTFSGNSADYGGGGMLNWDSSPTLTNVTFEANSAYWGGGMDNEANSNPTLANVTFSGNTASSSGGGMYNSSSSPTLSNSTFSGNSAILSGGGMYNSNTGILTATNTTFNANKSNTFGGGISNKGTLTLTGSSLITNTAGYGGGLYNYGTGVLSITGSTFITNTAQSFGGGVFNEGALTLTGSSLITNTAFSGGGLYNYGTGVLTVTESTIERNKASFGAGLLNKGTLTLTGSSCISNAAPFGGGLYNDSTGVGSVTDTTFQANGESFGTGGGLYNANTLTLIGSTFRYNNAYLGGGLFNKSTGVLTVTESTFRNNTAYSRGGGILNTGTLTATQIALDSNNAFDGVNAGTGGGLQNESGTVTLAGSTISFNDAVSGGGIYNASALTLISNTFTYNRAFAGGGGLFNYSTGTLTATENTFSNNIAFNGGGGIVNVGTLTATKITLSKNSAFDSDTMGTGGGFQNNPGAVATLTNCTISNNEAKGPKDDGGGGVMVYTATLHLVNCTITANSTVSDGSTGNGGGGISTTSGVTVTLQNTLVAGNTSTANKPDLSGVIISRGHNLIGSVDGSTGISGGVNGDIAGSNANPVEARLSILAEYQGSTQTHALLPGSPALDAGADCLATDQRDITRPQGSACDIGAFESRGFTLTLTSGNNQSTRSGTAFAAPLVVMVTANNPSEPVGPGGTITFSGPATGASLNPVTVITTTDAIGMASASVTANATVGGPYFVAVTTPGVAEPINVSLTNTAPGISVAGQGQAIASDDTTPTITDDTDFGDVLVTQSVTHTFTISNTGTGVLNLSGDPRVTLSGAAVGDFTVVQQPTTPITPGGSVTFQVRFTPSAIGMRGATISIASDDSGKNLYTFAIQGTGIFRVYLPLIQK